MRPDVLAGLSLTEDAGEHLAQLTRALDATWRQMADRMEEAGADAKVEIVVPEGGDRATLSGDKLGAVGEPESLTWLKNTTEAMLPRIDLPGPPERAAWPPPLTRRPARRGSRQLQHPDRHQDELEPAWPVDE